VFVSHRPPDPGRRRTAAPVVIGPRPFWPSTAVSDGDHRRKPPPAPRIPARPPIGFSAVSGPCRQASSAFCAPAGRAAGTRNLVRESVPGATTRPSSSAATALTAGSVGWPISMPIVTSVRDTGVTVRPALATRGPVLWFDGPRCVAKGFRKKLRQVGRCRLRPVGSDPDSAAAYIFRRTARRASISRCRRRIVRCGGERFGQRGRFSKLGLTRYILRSTRGDQTALYNTSDVARRATAAGIPVLEIHRGATRNGWSPR